jgi:hypothetical protein
MILLYSMMCHNIAIQCLKKKDWAQLSLIPERKSLSKTINKWSICSLNEDKKKQISSMYARKKLKSPSWQFIRRTQFLFHETATGFLTSSGRVFILLTRNK